MMRKLLAILSFLALTIGVAHAQFASPFDANGNLKGYAELQLKTASPGQLLQFGAAQMWKLPGGSYTIPRCDQPPPANATANGQADMWMGDFSGTANLSNITITCESIGGSPAGVIDGNPSFVISQPYQMIGLQWTGTTVKVITGYSPPPTVYILNVGQQGATTVAPNGQDAISTTLVVKSTTGFPSSAPFPVLVGGTEQELVTAISGLNYTVTRAYNGSPQTLHPSNSAVALIIASTITTGAVSGTVPVNVTVTSTANFPGSGTFDLALGAEHTLAHVVDGTTFSLDTRGIDGTTATTHLSGIAAKILTPTATMNDPGGISAGDTTVIVVSTAALPAAPTSFLMQIENEHMLGVVASPTTITLTRNSANGTTPASHADGTNILVLPTGCGTLPVNSGLTSGLFHDNGTTQVTNAGGIDVGTTLGGMDIAPGVPLTHGDNTPISGSTMLNSVFSNIASTQVCLSNHTTWSGSVYSARFPYTPQIPGQAQ